MNAEVEVARVRLESKNAKAEVAQVRLECTSAEDTKGMLPICFYVYQAKLVFQFELAWSK